MKDQILTAPRRTSGIGVGVASIALIIAGVAAPMTAAGAADAPVTIAPTAGAPPAGDPATADSGTPPKGLQGVLDLQDVFVSVAQKVDPAVVHIKAEIQEPDAGPDDNGGNGGPEQIFPFGPGQGQPFGTPQQRPRPRSGTSSGSGVILDADGTIVTNRHVVEGSSRVTVILNDRRVFSGTVYSDPDVDLAVVKIDAHNLPFVKLGDSTKLRIGQWALTVGYPFDVGESVSVGIVSALSRGQFIDERWYPNLIQTDASINPGNSGGALVDIYGNVIGISTLLAGSPTLQVGQSAGVGFAIPSEAVQIVVPQLANAPHKLTTYPAGWRRGMLGVSIIGVTPDLFKVLGVTEGALVKAVAPGGVADRAGVQAGDVIVKLNEKPIRDNEELIDVVSDLGPNQRAVLTIVRNRQTITRTVVTAVYGGQAGPAAAPARPRLGLTVETVNGENRAALKLPDNVQDGAVVTNVEAGSPAEAAEFKRGDVIYQVNDTPVHSARDFDDAAARARPGDSLGIKVYSDGTTAYRVLEIPDDAH